MNVVAVDAMGGDRAPGAIVEGAVAAVRELGLPVVLVGQRDVLFRELARYETRGLPLTVHDASEVVLMEDPPTQAVRGKRDNSIRVGLELVRRGEASAFVSAGNSGAVMTAAVVVLRHLPGIDRPAIALEIPSERGPVILLDAGANVESGPENLVQFAIMGAVFAKAVRRIEEPRVGLLSNGEEPSKGTDATRAADVALRQLPLRYVGYVEGRDIAAGAADVVVTDGFTGNAVLKSVEGFGRLFARLLEDVFRRNWRTKLAYLLLRSEIAGIRRTLDYETVGGAPLLGVRGVAILSHGSSGADAIRNAVRVAHEAASGDMIERMTTALGEVPEGAMLRRIGRRRGFWQQLKGRFRAERDGTMPESGEGEEVEGETGEAQPNPKETR